jgi:ABC-type cobalamin/Fe3+-siderophores transport system ATPase subunit
MLEIKNLTYNISKHRIINEMSVSFRNREITGFLGPSGAGKTSLLEILSGKLKNYQGSIKINSTELSDLSGRDLSEKTVLCESSWYNFNDESTLYNFILSGRLFNKRFLNPYSESDHLIADELTEKLNLNAYRDRKLKTLPHSVIQTARIARTLASRSEVTLFDDPDIYMNINRIKYFFRAIKKHASAGENIIIISSGNINFLANICDRILIIDKGGIIEDKLPDEISAELLKSVFNTDLVMVKNIITGKNEFQMIEE